MFKLHYFALCLHRSRLKSKGVQLQLFQCLNCLLFQIVKFGPWYFVRAFCNQENNGIHKTVNYYSTWTITDNMNFFLLKLPRISEERFWRNYFYRVSLIKQSTQLTSLAAAGYRNKFFVITKMITTITEFRVTQCQHMPISHNFGSMLRRLLRK